MLLLRTAGALALVLGLLFAFIYVLRRWGSAVKRPSPHSVMEVMSKHSFGPRHHLILVKVTEESKVLVGISPQNISLLCVLPEERRIADDRRQVMENG